MGWRAVLDLVPHAAYITSEQYFGIMLLSFGSASCLLKTWFGTLVSRTKNQPKEEVFGTDIPRTSGGHARGYPGPKLRSGRSKSWKNKHFGADIHDPKARTSTTLRGFQELRSEKLWAEFSFPMVVEACAAENYRSLTFLNCMCGSVHGTHLLNTPRRNAINFNARHIATRFTCTFMRTIQLSTPNSQ